MQFEARILGWLTQFRVGGSIIACHHCDSNTVIAIPGIKSLSLGDKMLRYLFPVPSCLLVLPVRDCDTKFLACRFDTEVADLLSSENGHCCGGLVITVITRGPQRGEDYGHVRRWRGLGDTRLVFLHIPIMPCLRTIPYWFGHERYRALSAQRLWSNTEFVDGIRQHELSRENYRKIGVTTCQNVTSPGLSKFGIGARRRVRGSRPKKSVKVFIL